MRLGEEDYRVPKMAPTLSVFATVASLALAGPAHTGVAAATTSEQYEGTTSQKVGGSALRIDLTVGSGALTSVTWTPSRTTAVLPVRPAAAPGATSASTRAR